MHWMYLIPLGTGLVTGYYTLRSSDEITSFTGAFALICLLISLFIAPWELQLLILVLVIAAARYYWQQLQTQIETPPEIPPKVPVSSALAQNNPSQATVSQEKPQLTSPRIYRGLIYDVKNQPQPALEGTNQKSPQPPRYLGLPYETAGTPVPPLDQMDN